ncbi:MAG: CBS domain-containing protein [Verrucomicrobia bacterium]|nr:CBS domain-containing protein [Kiritimatiellia bacterium]MCO6401863.1 CBS domain-containing protein [Verrucomicrobiota bacterium]
MNRVPTVRDIMVTKLVTLRPEQPIRDAIDILLKNRISGAAVLDDKGALIGMLSEKDCLNVIANDAFHNTDPDHVSDYMSRTLTTIEPEADIFRAADMFLKNSFRRLPVVENGRVVGQISRRDVLNASRLLADAPPVPKPWSDSKYITDEVKAALADKPKPQRS